MVNIMRWGKTSTSRFSGINPLLTTHMTSNERNFALIIFTDQKQLYNIERARWRIILTGIGLQIKCT